jgi:hypothetical protein
MKTQPSLMAKIEYLFYEKKLLGLTSGSNPIETIFLRYGAIQIKKR